VISGNDVNGISIIGLGTSNNRVLGSIIGLVSPATRTSLPWWASPSVTNTANVIRDAGASGT
jgi:hypothetical protein